MNSDAGFEQNTIGNTMHQTDKKCPKCGGVTVFNPATGKLRCPYCETEFDIVTAQDQIQNGMEENFFSAKSKGNCDWGTATKTIICKACGGETVYDSNTLSSVCPYCGSNQVMETASDTMAPVGVCTFKVEKKSAADKFYTWIKKKLFCPSKAKKNCKPDAFSGVYIPLWTFDTDTVTDYTAKYGIERTYKDKDGNTHTETDWYSVSGTHIEFIDDHPVIATERYNSSQLDAILPFDTAHNLAYKPEYLAGFAAEKYSIGLNDAWDSARSEINDILSSNITHDIKIQNNADKVDNLKLYTVFNDLKYKYLLAPIWLSSFKYKNKVFNFMVNGETGKVSGKSPVSALRVAIASLIALGIIGLIIWLVMR